MKKYLIYLFAVFSSDILIAGTDGTIRGKVTDIDGMGLPGANVIISELGMGAAADMDGNYILLNVPDLLMFPLAAMMFPCKWLATKSKQLKRLQSQWISLFG